MGQARQGEIASGGASLVYRGLSSPAPPISLEMVYLSAVERRIDAG